MMDQLKTLLKENPHVDICFNSNGFKVGAKNTDMKYWRRFDWKLLDADRIERAIEKVKKPTRDSSSSRGPLRIPGPETPDFSGFQLMDDDEMAMGASVKRRGKARRSTHRRSKRRSSVKSSHNRSNRRRSMRRRRR
jgi:hypothetical protein